MFFKEVDYKFMYNNTLRFVLQRKYFNLNSNKRLRFDVFFWYKMIQADDFKLYKFFDNLILIWLLLEYKLNFLEVKTLFKLNVYYKYSMYRTSIVSFGKILKDFDVIINGLMSSVRRRTIQISIFNDKNIIRIVFFDLSNFSSIKLGVYFYVENVVDDLYIDYILFGFNIVKFLDVFKLLFYLKN